MRLVYAPSGETSGYLTFPLRALATVAGRPMLGGLKLLLDSVRLFTDADERRLPALLRKSREAQAAVSTALAEQVLGALHELLRGLDAAEPKLIRELARDPARASLRGSAHGADAARLYPLRRGSRSLALAHRWSRARNLRDELFRCAASTRASSRTPRSIPTRWTSGAAAGAGCSLCSA